MFRMDNSLLSAADDFYKGSWSGLDAVKAGGESAEGCLGQCDGMQLQSIQFNGVAAARYGSTEVFNAGLSEMSSPTLNRVLSSKIMTALNFNFNGWRDY